MTRGRVEAPLVTVVVPAFNAAATIEPTIRSILAQTLSDLEVIVVDDGSHDDTVGVVRRIEAQCPVKLVQRENGGPSAARNSGLEVARGRFVSVLDSDDLWLPRYLEVMTTSLARAPKAGFAYTDAWVYDDERKQIRRRTAMAGQRPPSPVPAEARPFFDLLLDRNFVYTSVTAHREVLERVGGYDERLWTAEDYELWLRLTARGYSAVRAPGTLAIHRERNGSLSSDLRRLLAGRCEVYRIVAEEYELPDDVRARARAYERRWTTSLQNSDGTSGGSPFRRVARRAHTAAQRLAGRNEWLGDPPLEVQQALGWVDGSAIS